MNPSNRQDRRLGIKAEIEPRLRPMGAGEPPIAAQKGDVQFAVAPLSRILAAPGISPVAIFPPELGLDIPMSLFVHRGADREMALRLIRFLSDPDHDALLRTRGVHRYALDDVPDQHAAGRPEAPQPCRRHRHRGK